MAIVGSYLRFLDIVPRVLSLEATRENSLGFVSSDHLADFPLVATQSVVNATQPFIDNLWAGIQEVFPVGAAEIRPTDPTGIAGTIGTSTVLRVYEELEGKISVGSYIEIEDQSVGSVTWDLFAVSGVDINTVAANPAFGVGTTIRAIGGTSNQNEFTDGIFDNEATVKPFPGFDGLRRFVDLAFQISHGGGAPRTIQLRQSYGKLVVFATA